ncbi:phosphoglycerate kinase [Patescibacteria group bacterium AH-259-L05]|nr:phosphoglycerate kinase [Patescibacteria group bacterium AH-259-L05]
MKLKTLRQIKDFRNRRVLVRVDFNCPLEDVRPRILKIRGRTCLKVVDDCRIRFALPTIEYLVERGAKVILISHLGRPRGERVEKYSLKLIYRNLETRFPKIKVRFINDCLGKKVKQAVDSMKAGEVALLENLRFYAQEEENDPKFAKQLADLADIYINDAFSVSHRKHASVSAITKYLPSYAGYLLEKEVDNLSQVLQKPQHPFVVIMGGVKISTKIGAIENLSKFADHILVGGALSNNFLKAQGVNIGKSVYEPKMIKTAKKLLQNKKIVLPVDFKTKSEPRSPTQSEILDIGSETIKLFSPYISKAKMIVWNGPMGYFENKKFGKGTKAIAQEILKNKTAKIIIGGGETISALRKFKVYSLQSRVRNEGRVFISTGGGAMLAFLSGKSLPGIKPLIQ